MDGEWWGDGQYGGPALSDEWTNETSSSSLPTACQAECSTPSRTNLLQPPSCGESPVRAVGPVLGKRDWSFLPGDQNIGRGRDQRIVYSDEGEQSIVEETNKRKTGLRWRAVDPSNLKFVDHHVEDEHGLR